MQGDSIDKKSLANNYLTVNFETITKMLNDFDLHEIIDWTEFKKVAERI